MDINNSEFIFIIPSNVSKTYPVVSIWYGENGTALPQLKKITVLNTKPSRRVMDIDITGLWVVTPYSRINTSVLVEPADSIVYHKNGDSRSVTNVGTYLSN